MAYTITQLENAIIAALDVSPINTYAKTIGGYAGQLEQDVGKALLIMPAVLVVFSGDDFRAAQGQSTVYNRIVNFQVLAACKNLRGSDARRQGVGSEVGIYEMLDDIRSKLVGNKLSLNIEPLRILGRRPVLISDIAYIYAAEFQTQLDYIKT